MRQGLVASGSILVDYTIDIDDWPNANGTCVTRRSPIIATGGVLFNPVEALSLMKYNIDTSQ